MSKIVISLCGEGRGHATRIATLVERLDDEHEILVFTSDDGFAFLSHRFAAGSRGFASPRFRGSSSSTPAAGSTS
jgi:UDP:flavonoid glycosyltransferase YjiC (YdhE family)